MGSGIGWTGSPEPVPLIGLGRQLLRALLIGVTGAAVGLVAFGLSRVGGELLSTMFMILAVFMIPLTVGAVIAAVFTAWQESPRTPRTFTTTPGSRERCGLCHRKMTLIGQLWLCSVCDSHALRTLTGNCS